MPTYNVLLLCRVDETRGTSHDVNDEKHDMKDDIGQRTRKQWFERNGHDRRMTGKRVDSNKSRQ